MKQRKGWRMSCDVGKATEGLENELWRRWSDGKFGEWAVTYVIQQKGWRMSWRRWSDKKVGKWVELILQPLRHFIYVTTHFPTLPSHYLRHSSFSNPSLASPTFQFILQPFVRFSYVTSSSLNSPGEPPMSLGEMLNGGDKKWPTNIYYTSMNWYFFNFVFHLPK